MVFTKFKKAEFCIFCKRLDESALQASQQTHNEAALTKISISMFVMIEKMYHGADDLSCFAIKMKA